MNAGPPPIFDVYHGGTGYGWFVRETNAVGWHTVAGPYTTRESAQREATRLADTRGAHRVEWSPPAPAGIPALAGETARTALHLTFERYDSELAELRARVAVLDDEVAELRAMLTPDHGRHSVRA